MGKRKYFFTLTFICRSHCACDNAFYKCLKKANSIVSNRIGETFFNVLKPQCFRKEFPIVGCIKKRLDAKKKENKKLFSFQVKYKICFFYTAEIADASITSLMIRQRKRGNGLTIESTELIWGLTLFTNESAEVLQKRELFNLFVKYFVDRQNFLNEEKEINKTNFLLHSSHSISQFLTSFQHKSIETARLSVQGA